MFLSQSFGVIVSVPSFSFDLNQKIVSQKNPIKNDINYCGNFSHSIFNYNYYITDVTTQASLNMNIAATRYKYKFSSFQP